MAIPSHENSLIGTTPAEPTPPVPYSLVREKSGCSGPSTGLRCLRGESSKTTASTNEPDGRSKESTARCSGTNRRRGALTSFDRRTQLLMRFGLVAGTIPTWTPPLFDLQIPDGVSSVLDGANVDSQRADCSFLNGLPFDHIYRWKKFGTRFTGRRCRVLARGAMNSVLVEFDDGEKAVCSRYAVRKAGPG